MSQGWEGQKVIPLNGAWSLDPNMTGGGGGASGNPAALRRLARAIIAGRKYGRAGPCRLTVG